MQESKILPVIPNHRIHINQPRLIGHIPKLNRVTINRINILIVKVAAEVQVGISIVNIENLVRHRPLLVQVLIPILILMILIPPQLRVITPIRPVINDIKRNRPRDIGISPTL